ncbi:MAG: hypothetical protein K9L86_03315 [Candidatus Omnitrophica bacterium]|nr:hypothetical protein [Candidatus Omnitrophota bacterium]
MAKAGIVFLKIFRVLIGLVLLVYSACLLGSFFSVSVHDYIGALGQQYKVIGFIFAGLSSTPAFAYLSLFVGSIYFLAAISILSLKHNPRIGATYILFSVWVFIVFILALKIKEGIGVGFSNPDFIASVTDFFKIMVPLVIPALFLPFFTGGE